VVACVENELRLGRCGELEGSLEVLVEPQGRSDLELGRETVVQMGGESVADIPVLDERTGAVGVVHNAVEIVGGSQVEERGFDVRSVGLELHRGPVSRQITMGCYLRLLGQKWPRIGREPRSPHLRNSRLDPFVRSRYVDGQAAAHGEAVHAKSVRINFGLCFEECQPTTGSKGQEIPVVVAG